MKGVFRITTAAALLFSMHAQAQVHLRPELGVNFAHMRLKYTDGKETFFEQTKSLARPRVGFNASFFHDSKLYLETGLFYSGKGSKEPGIEYYFPDYNTGAFKPLDTATLYFSTNYIELPINAVYEIKLRKYGSLSAAAGVYFARLMNGERLFKSDKSKERFDMNIWPVHQGAIWHRACQGISQLAGIGTV